MFVITYDTKRIFQVLKDFSVIEYLPTEKSFIKVVNRDFIAKYQSNNSEQYGLYKEFQEDELLDKIEISRKYLNKFYSLAENLVKTVFEGVVDKGGSPYINHLYYVANTTSDLRSRLVGLLHDTIEDTHVTYNDLEIAFGEDIAEAVQALSKVKNETNDDYLKRVKQTYFSIESKLADLAHNMDLNRLSEVTDKDRKRLEKYKKSYILLSECKQEFIVE